MGSLVKSLSFLNPLEGLSRSQPTVYNIITRNYAARKGTREKARKNKVKVEEKKAEFIPHNQRGLDKLLLSRQTKKFDDSWKQKPTDNVYPIRYYQWRVYSFVEAVQCHRETHHPTMYNEPNAPLNVIIELNMEAEKKTRFVDNFTRVVAIPHEFDHGEERNIIVFTKDIDMQEKARDMGASLVGGPELIKNVQTGDISLQDFQYAIAHPNILPELVSLRGLMKKKFPNPKNGTLNSDVVSIVKKYLTGIHYTAKKDDYEKDFGCIQTTVGPLSMDPKYLEENFEALLNDVYSMKPKRPGIFIRRCMLVSPPCTEKLKVDYEVHLKSEETEDDDEMEERASA